MQVCWRLTLVVTRGTAGCFHGLISLLLFTTLWLWPLFSKRIAYYIMGHNGAEILLKYCGLRRAAVHYS